MTLLGERSMNGHRPRHDRVGTIDWPLEQFIRTSLSGSRGSHQCAALICREELPLCSRVIVVDCSL